MATPSLYRRVLGASFDQLPEVLRRFHDGAKGGSARGAFRVVRGDGIFRNSVAGLLRMPRAGEDVPIRLEVVVKGDREQWLRHFPGRCTRTVQWADGNLLMERFGLISFSRCGWLYRARVLAMNSGERGLLAFLCRSGFRPMSTVTWTPVRPAGGWWCTFSRRFSVRSSITKGGSSWNE